VSPDARAICAALYMAARADKGATTHEMDASVALDALQVLETALAGLPKDDTREPGSVPVGWVAGVLDDISMALAYHDGPDAITKGLDAINRVRAELAQFRGAP
jgi:hypothetical protein